MFGGHKGLGINNKQKKLEKCTGLVALLLPTALLPLLVWFTYLPCVLVEEPPTKKILWAAPLKRDEQFQVRYIHSVDLLPVYEVYAYRDGKLVLLETMFKSWGAGLGYTGEGIISEEDGWTAIRQMEREIGVIPLRVGTIAEHTILYRNEEVLLREYVPAQTLVHIRVKKRFVFLE